MNIKSAEFITSCPDYESVPDSDIPEFAFIGRSNVGKSSLINMLTNQKDLAIVSSKPGRTQMINLFLINDSWTLVDLPGYGFAKISKSKQEEFHEFVSEYLTSREQLRCVFVLIDSKIPPQKLDLEFCQWLMECSIPFVLVFTKTDRAKKGGVEKNIAAFTEAMSEWCDGLPRIYQASAKTASGRGPLLHFIDQAARAR
ncbi:ribosome biogenesis GTP-binding protein YihA/YsxC [Persicirhabdus sediminis]|uniref:Probable GTP-binding protein EngB n=1 Tax=Persicirhabdus sediminis TaxID=454144 RepID=A0A8J7SI01_9BACT|nr:ribosome biogenesis GTP-binding protein YihA/YsxC [Persicirhabdus sediminis]MBK1791130.1 YihA family ribosome biogenesis GTP-binding protein [Persicirhabdus sediminis]